MKRRKRGLDGHSTNFLPFASGCNSPGWRWTGSGARLHAFAFQIGPQNHHTAARRITNWPEGSPQPKASITTGKLFHHQFPFRSFLKRIWNLISVVCCFSCWTTNWIKMIASIGTIHRIRIIIASLFFLFVFSIYNLKFNQFPELLSRENFPLK